MQDTNLSPGQLGMKRLAEQLNSSFGRIFEQLNLPMDAESMKMLFGSMQVQPEETVKELPMGRRERRARARYYTHKRSRPAKQRPRG